MSEARLAEEGAIAPGWPDRRPNSDALRARRYYNTKTHTD
jgi:hypothetical protein